MPWSKRIPVPLSAHSRCRIFRGQWQEATGKAAISTRTFPLFSLLQFQSETDILQAGPFRIEALPHPRSLRDRSYSIDLLRVIYCGLEESRLFGFEAGTGSAGA